jgi:hypothetical protein
MLIRRSAPQPRCWEPSVSLLIGIEGLSAHLKEDTKRREDDGKNDLADIAGNQSVSDDEDGLRQTARSAQGLKIELTLR